MDLEGSTRRNLSRFEHEAKTEKADMRSQGNTRAKGRQSRTEQGRGDGHKRIEHQAKKTKTSTDNSGVDKEEREVKVVAMSTRATKRR